MGAEQNDKIEIVLEQRWEVQTVKTVGDEVERGQLMVERRDMDRTEEELRDGMKVQCEIVSLKFIILSNHRF